MTTELVVACPTCGLVHEDLAAAESEIRRLRRKVSLLQGELDKQRKDDPQSQAVDRLFKRWQVALGHPKAKLGPGREKALLRALGLFDEETVGRAIDGCARMPFVGPHGRQSDGSRGAKRHDDLVLVCRDETTIERFASYADEPVKPSGDRLRVERLAWGIWRANGGSRSGVDRWPDVRAEWVAHADSALRLARAGDGFVEDSRGDTPDAVVYRQLGVRTGPLQLRDVLEAFAARDLNVTGRPPQLKGQCPVHNDRTPSVSITEKPDGRVLLNCFGCQAGHLELVRALGLFGRERVSVSPAQEAMAA